METLIQEAVKNGIWALMFISYFVYKQKIDIKREEETRKTNDSREKRYIDTIDKNHEVIQNLSEALKCVDDISDDIKNIKQCLLERKR